MRILNISQSFEINGGSDVYFYLLSKLLRENGIEVDEFASDSKEGIYPRAIDFENKTPTNLFKYIYNFEAKNKLAGYLSEKKYDLAHLQIYYGKLTASILSPLKTAGIPIVQTLHEYKLVCPTYKLYDGNDICTDCKNNQFYRALFKKCNRNDLSRTALSAIESYVSLWQGAQTKVDHFITVSDFQKSQIVKMGFNAHKLTTVHNFVQTTPHLSNNTGEFVLYFGRIEKVKGIDTLLQAFSELPPTIKLVIAGDGTYKNEMLSRINQSKFLSANTTYLGFKNSSEIAALIKACRFAVVPSIWYETFGLTVVETMAYGKPVIGSNIGGITEIIDDGIDGFLVEPNDHTSLKNKIIELWHSETLRDLMNNNAVLKVKEKFSPEAHFAKLCSVYQKILG